MGWNLRGLNRVWDDFTGNTAIDQQNEYNMQMWKMQQEYNTPANQMARYRAAGLNPNLIYGGSGQMAGNATSAPEMQAHQSGVGKFLNLIQVARGLFDMKKEKDAMDLEKAKVLSNITHTQQAFELEKKKMLLDHLFRTEEFDWRKSNAQKDYDLRKAAHILASDRLGLDREKWLFEKANIDKWGAKPGTTVDFLSHLIGNAIGRTPYEVAGDTNTMLNMTFQKLFSPIGTGEKPHLKSKGSFYQKHVKNAYRNPSDSIGFWRMLAE